MADTNDFLGRGWKFPPQIDSSTGRFMVVEYEEDIKEAIYIILMTKFHERVMIRDFGSNINSYLFTQIDFTILNLLKQDIIDALTRWEPRIMNLEVEVEQDPQENSKINIIIKYTARATNNPFNLVYPFYINEGFGEE